MSAAAATAVAGIATALSLAAVLRILHNRRSGTVRDTAGAADLGGTGELGLSETGPTIVHFTAEWCGPCAAVRRLVTQVCAELPQVAHVEIDLDSNPVAGRKLSVLSLPTTFIFDAEGRQRYRMSGIPKTADLRAALDLLLA